MIADIGVIRGAVQCEIESDLDAASAGFAQKPDKIIESPEGGFHAAMSPGLTTDRPGGAHVVRFAGYGIVFPLPVRHSDGVNRREIDHIESHRCGVFNPGKAVAKGGVMIRKPFGTAREEFVPGGKGG